MLKKMPRLALATAMLATVALTGCSVTINSEAGCRYSEPRSVTVPVASAKAIRIAADAGSLNVTSKAGLTEVRVTGTACAAREADLQRITLRGDVVGDEARVEANVPNTLGFSPRLDMTVEIPAGLALRVDDSSGDAVIQGVGALELTKGSGSTMLEQIAGDLRVQTSSGTLTISDVKGNARIAAGSGTLTVRNMTGEVTLTDKSSGTTEFAKIDGNLNLLSLGSGELRVDGVTGALRLDNKSSGTVQITDVNQGLKLGRVGSGDLRVQTVKGEVTLEQKSSGTVSIQGMGKSVRLTDVGSGSLEVRDVQGDLVVESKSSGSISQSGIQGQVRIPSR